MAETLSDTIGTLIDTISLVLIAFAAISLVVSTIMIGIITYVSVIERTKEIGILRSVGARKKDISRVFNAEALIIGFTAGAIGVALTYILSVPINIIVSNLAGISGIAALNPMYIILLIGGSMLLTLVAGFIPSRMAANKDPVIALRTE
jgi:putative ABC transport system permease protein